MIRAVPLVLPGHRFPSNQRRAYPVANLGQYFRNPFSGLQNLPSGAEIQAMIDARFREVVAGDRELDEIAAANLELAQNVWKTFPFPPPRELFKGFWLNRAGADLTGPVFSGQPLIEAELRTALSLSALEHYDDVMADIQAYEKKRAKKRKKRALVKKLILGALGTVIGIVVPVAGALWAVGEAGLSVQERKEAAEDLEKAAKQFDTEDSAFAAELRKTAQVLDYQAQQAQASAALTQEEIEAIQEPDEPAAGEPGAAPGTGVPSTPPSEGIPTAVYVGGGIAAAAAIAFAVFA